MALDLETTGLSSKSEAITEVGAVRFRGDERLDTFETFVNPVRKLSDFIIGYTGITQADVDGAPLFEEVIPDLAAFIGGAPVVGHNVSFDLDFLAVGGLRVSNPTADTWELAYVLRPAASSYGLARIAAELGVVHDRPHRALEDAIVTGQLFVALVKEANELEIDVLAEIDRAARRSNSRLAYVTSSLAEQSVAMLRDPDRTPTLGFDLAAVRSRIQKAQGLRPSRDPEPVDVEMVARVLGEDGALSTAMPGFEHRAEQVAMARAVAEAVNAGAAQADATQADAKRGNGRLIVEAGTGVGKSLAYLLPAVLYALKNDARVVVSTNTINLQEQLISKDLPVLIEALKAVGGAGEEPVRAEGLRATQLKGRANYLCLNRLLRLRANESPSDAEARMLAKLLVWLRETTTGDRAEINLGGRGVAAPWDRLSAQGASDCNGVSGVCFLRAARERAASAHLVIVNHALLMADLATDGSILPDHDVLIIDEAHHLEESATRQLGFELTQGAVQDHLAAISGDGGVLSTAVTVLRGESVADSRRQTVLKIATDATAMAPKVREEVAGLLAETGKLADGSGDDRRGGSRSSEVRVTGGTRAQPAWSDLEAKWERVDVALAELSVLLTRLLTALDDLGEADLPGYEGVVVEAAELSQANDQMRVRLTEFFPHPDKDSVYWVSRSTRQNRSGRPPEIGLHAAPLQVGTTLEEMIYSRTGTVVMTSATLAADGKFDHLVERTGFQDAEQLMVGSPFDYPNAALVCLPDDVPEPSSWAYQGAVEQAIADAAIAAGGRTMALFTSYASLQQAANALRPALQPHDITVLAQGNDGTPYRIVADFISNPRSVILGVASFWEGVDLAGESLQVLLVARLPFSVPTDPIFSARSELFEDSFRQYAVPEAVLKLRQGFGRLIRTSSDRGVAVILDRRIVSKGYGKTFTRSLPPATFAKLPLAEIPGAIREFLDR